MSNRYVASTQTPLYIPGSRMNAYKHELEGQILKEKREQITAIANAEQPEEGGKRRSERQKLLKKGKVEGLWSTQDLAEAGWAGGIGKAGPLWDDDHMDAFYEYFNCEHT